MIVTDEEADVTELLWVVVIVDVDIWVVFWERLVTLVVDFKVVEVTFVETCVVVLLDVTGFKVVTVPFFEAVETEVVDGFVVGFGVVTVPFFETEVTGIVDGFTVLLEDSSVWLAGTRVVFPVGSAEGFSSSTEGFLLEDPPESSLSTATFSSASTSSAPTMKKAKPPRAPSPIVLSAGCGGLVGLQPW